MEKADQARFQRYLSELSIQLSKNDYFVRPELSGRISVHWQDEPLCQVESIGGITYRNENIATPEREAAKDHAFEIVRMVAEYTRQLEQAPHLKTAGLEDSFKLLADFNGTVLAAQETKYGIHFVTWDWDFNRKGLSHGHYYESNYLGAKQDFATRSGLIDKHHLFSDEQLAEVYRCVHETLESHYPMTVEREQLLKAVAEQIEYGVPSLDELVEQSNLKEMEVESSEPYQGMTQQI